MLNVQATTMELEQLLGYSFRDIQLLVSALSHSSYVNERRINKQQCYERLEFLGDAVLECVASRYIFEKYPEFTEGQLSKTRASMVCEKSLAWCARRINLGSFILLGHGETKNHGQDRDSILCDVMESIAGAIYLDGGFEAATEYIRRFILSQLDEMDKPQDYKTELQELVQSDPSSTISYETVSEDGPDHCKHFVVDVYIDGEFYGQGEGSSRKHAESAAAQTAIQKYRQGMVK